MTIQIFAWLRIHFSLPIWADEDEEEGMLYIFIESHAWILNVCLSFDLYIYLLYPACVIKHVSQASLKKSIPSCSQNLDFKFF